MEIATRVPFCRSRSFAGALREPKHAKTPACLPRRFFRPADGAGETTAEPVDFALPAYLFGLLSYPFG